MLFGGYLDAGPRLRRASAEVGGCRVALVEVAQAERFAEYVTEACARATGIEPRVYTVQASEGAGNLL